MHRTTIMLPPELKAQAQRFAEARRTSLGEVIRRALADLLERAEAPEGDPLLADDAVFTGEAPFDLADNHDRYLYGEGGER